MTRGLTLVELVLTITLTAILGIPASIILSRQLQGAMGARDATVAMSLARQEMERLDGLNNFCHADLAVNTPPGPPPIDPYLNSSYALTRAVSCLAGGGSCSSACAASPGGTDNAVKRIEIIVTRSGTTQRVASLVSYRTKYVRYGL